MESQDLTEYEECSGENLCPHVCCREYLSTERYNFTCGFV
jgi:hypothetical protein